MCSMCLCNNQDIYFLSAERSIFFPIKYPAIVPAIAPMIIHNKFDSLAIAPTINPNIVARKVMIGVALRAGFAGAG